MTSPRVDLQAIDLLLREAETSLGWVLYTDRGHALGMALHPRLGGASDLRKLGPDLIHKIMRTLPQS